MAAINGELGEVVTLKDYGDGSIAVRIVDATFGGRASAVLLPAERRELAAALLEGLEPVDPAMHGGVLSKDEADEMIAALKAGKTITFKLSTEPRS